MIEKFDELYLDAQKFENDSTRDIRDRNPIYIAWIGFLLDEAYHRYMKNFKYNNKLQTRFLLSPTGEPFGACEYMMRITQLEKSQVTLMIDDQQSTHNEPYKSEYIDQDAGFTEDDVYTGDSGVHSVDPAFSRNHYFFQTNIETMDPSFRKLVEEGQTVFVMPEAMQKYCRYRSRD